MKPILIPNSEGKPTHPLLVIREDWTVATLGELLGHANHCTVAIYCGRAKRDPEATIPAEWVPQLSRVSGIAPYILRPDLYEKSMRFSGTARRSNKVAKRG